ncbi:MAG: hypothetical protein ACE147_21660 [Candidatus Methylomirabilales bacterium]
MDFRRVLDTITRFLDERGFRYAVIGAFALSVYGVSRATQDIDFVVDAAGQRDLNSTPLNLEADLPTRPEDVLALRRVRRRRFARCTAAPGPPPLSSFDPAGFRAALLGAGAVLPFGGALAYGLIRRESGKESVEGWEGQAAGAGATSEAADRRRGDGPPNNSNPTSIESGT